MKLIVKGGEERGRGLRGNREGGPKGSELIVYKKGKKEKLQVGAKRMTGKATVREEGSEQNSKGGWV